MQSVWSSGSWSVPIKWRPPAGTLPLAVMVFLMLICFSNSTVDANWVPNSAGLTNLALVAALVMGVLALIAPIPWPVALLVGGLLAPLAAFVGAHQALVHAHPNDPTDPLRLLNTWSNRIISGDAFDDLTFLLYLIYLLFWVVGGWLSWCAFRWRQPLLGIVPGAAAFATTVLNFPSDQNGYVVAFLTLTLAMLLWTSYVRFVQNVVARRVRLSSDARWDFWETGVVVMAGVIVIGLLAPPLTTSDRTIDIENGSFRGWAELQQRLNHPVAFGRGTSSGTSTGFASLAQLAGPIQKTGGVVFTYSIEGTYGGPRYFRGINLDTTSTGPGGASWRFGGDTSTTVSIEKDAVPPYAENYTPEASAAFKIQMLKPPDRAADVFFYPSTLLKLDHSSVARAWRGSQPPAGLIPGEKLDTVDRLSLPGHGRGVGSYKVTVAYPTATEDQLRAASTAYPAWLDPYRNFGATYRSNPESEPSPVSGNYRSKQTLQRIQDLARSVTEGKDNPYDKASAIESYLRANYKYTLTPQQPTIGADPLEYFLFTSKEGYCEYFASAMGDMLRSIGIPTRLVNGYGPGTYDDKLNRYVVREADAHTWVEAYFPGNGWIPFEPTPDGTYFPIPRGAVSAVCARDSEVCSTGEGAVGPGGDVLNRPDKGALDAGDLGSGGGSLNQSPIPGGLPTILVALVLLAAGAWIVVSRYLRPRTISGVWKRTSMLSGLAGVQRQSGETPIEFGDRLGREMPEAASPARTLAEQFAVAAYAPPDKAVTARTSVLTAWEELRPLLLKRVRGRVRLAS
jgi:transglutaminase-like putative cysteine protease